MKIRDSFFVLHINTARTWRGGEQQVLYLAQWLKSVKIDQLLVCRTGSEIERRADEAGIPVMPMAIYGELDIFAAYRMARWLTRNVQKPVIIHAHTAAAHSLGIWLKKFHPGARLVVSRRVDFPHRGNFFSRLKYKSREVDRYLAISQNVKRILILDGIPDERISIAYSGIDLNRFTRTPDITDLKNEFQIQDDEIILGNVAACVDHKDQKTLIEAIHILEEKFEREWAGSIRYRLFIVGEGKLRHKLEAQASGYQLLNKRIIFTGFRNDVIKFLNLFNIFVMSSKEEGLGTSVLDAMAVGLPVVSTAGGGIPEMVDDGKGGYLSPVGDAFALAGSLRKMILSYENIKKFGDYNRTRVQNFSNENTGVASLHVYQELLGSR